MTGAAIRRTVGLAALVVVAAVGGFLWGERRATTLTSEHRPPQAAPTPAARTVVPASSTEEPVEVTLTAEAIGRAGIRTEVVGRQTTTASITVPGTVVSHAYRDTKATALVGGIVRTVNVELGSSVARGQALAILASTELAEAQMKYLSAQAMLAADHQKLTRTGKLVALGAASRQELEEITAVHAAHEAEVAAARQRLLLLGLSPQRIGALRGPDEIVSDVAVPAPGDGTVIARAINPGQVVTAGQELFVVADLSRVWVIGELYERDLAVARTGAEASVTVPGLSPLRGRVSYVDPRVDLAARTAKVRVEVANPAGELRLGMFVNVGIVGPSSGGVVTVVPRAAVQAIGNRTVVYVAAEGDGGRFIERPIKVGAPIGSVVEVVEGLKAGERVVSEGSFFLRAEAARTRSGT